MTAGSPGPPSRPRSCGLTPRPTTAIAFDPFDGRHAADFHGYLDQDPALPTRRWIRWTSLHWFAALRAKVAALAGDPDARDHVTGARAVVAGNPVAEALVERAEALLDGDQERLLATAAVCDVAACRYQSARTTVLAGGDRAVQGEAAIVELGLAPMAPFRGP